MKILHIAPAVFAAVLLAASAHAASDALPVTNHKLTEKTKYYEINVEYPQTGMKAIDDDIVRSVNEYANNFANLARSSYDEKFGADTLDTDITIVRNDAQVFIVLFESETDMHGAHPNQDMWTANYFRRDGWRFYLPELYDSDRMLPVMSKLVVADLDKRIATGQDAMSDPDTIKMGAGPVATNFAVFALLPNAIHIWFPPYQVASYAAGPQEAEVPLAPLKPFTRANVRAPAASFDCTKAKSPIEIAVCSDVTLARLDRGVSEEYASAVTDSNDDKEKAGKRDVQRAWLASRNLACGDAKGPAFVACLTRLYKARARQLNPEQ